MDIIFKMGEKTLMGKRSFTLVEMMMVLIVVSIIAAFALPAYKKAIRKSHMREAEVQLIMFHGANEMYNRRQGEYYGELMEIMGPGMDEIMQMNADMEINLLPGELLLTYRKTKPEAYWMHFRYIIDDDMIFKMRLTHKSLQDNNPCCVVSEAPTCAPLIPNC